MDGSIWPTHLSQSSKYNEALVLRVSSACVLPAAARSRVFSFEDSLLVDKVAAAIVAKLHEILRHPQVVQEALLASRVNAAASKEQRVARSDKVHARPAASRRVVGGRHGAVRAEPADRVDGLIAANELPVEAASNIGAKCVERVVVALVVLAAKHKDGVARLRARPAGAHL